ncbi:MAG: hypothetical protein KJ060_19040, partial [Candidatus Hydrogenedentes bacterium]|nr:hypothetical protein [Candidatus Hydrogenedentota bacterium]
DVAAGLQVSFEEADELILEYGISEACINEEFAESMALAMQVNEERGARVKLKTAVPGAPPVVDRGDLEMIIFERAKELLIKVRQYLHARGLSKHLVRGVVLTGGASRIKNYTALAEAVFQVPCRVGLPNSVEIRPAAVQAPEFSAAIGIVRHALDYRDAARNGRIEPRGPVVSVSRRLMRFFKRYFL